MRIEDFDKYGKVRFHSDEYVLVGMEGMDGCVLGVRIGEKCDADGFYPAKWIELDAVDRMKAVAIVEEEGQWESFNPTTEMFQTAIA